jgi:hypothetical protein
VADVQHLSDEYLLECEQRARRFQGAWFGTSGDLAARLMHALGEIQRLKVELARREEKHTCGGYSAR